MRIFVDTLSKVLGSPKFSNEYGNRSQCKGLKEKKTIRDSKPRDRNARFCHLIKPILSIVAGSF